MGVEREVERVADRLRILGSRVDDARLALVAALLQRLADLAADADHRPRRPVPLLGRHAWGDQVLVLGHDVIATADESALEAAESLLVEVRHAL